MENNLTSNNTPFVVDFMKKIPLLPLRDTLLFPSTAMRILVGREVSIQAIDAAHKNDDVVVLALQRDVVEEEVSSTGLYSVGVVARIQNVIPVPNGYFKVLLEGLFTVDITEVTKETFFEALVAPRKMINSNSAKDLKLAQSVIDEFSHYALDQEIQEDFLDTLRQLDQPIHIYYGILPFIRLSLTEKQAFLEATSLKEVAEKIQSVLYTLKESLQVTKKVRRDVQQKMQQSQKEWIINEQIRLLQEELGDSEFGGAEHVILAKKIKAKNFSAAIQEKLDEELERMKMMQPTSPEYAVIRNYIDWFLALPYNEYCQTELNLKKVKKELDKKHYGLEKVKERILEYLAVLKLTGSEKRAPILCLVGPPGVGKTTLVSSIAQAMERSFVRITLGGVRDEAEIRGHRRTYIGAMPGRFIQALRRAKCMNPVILLDEIDKMASDFRGDPASAMLEVLDPELNQDFTDHFMETGFDLSRVLFIATANTESDIPEALHDRLEIVRLPGYYVHEKMKIASEYLIPEVCERSGVALGKDIQISNEMIHKIIRDYTREAGVRELERLLSSVVRHRAKELVLNKKNVPALTEKQVSQYLGVPRFLDSRLPLPGRPGLITGLAWTSVGGEILTIECMLLSGKGHLQTTGKLGEVMKESAQIALSLVRARLQKFDVDPSIVRKTDIHIHVPEGAVPKDGPSAGIALTLALLSAFTNRVVDPKIAFTGEVSLTGSLHAIGGLNEKALAALDAGVTTLFLPKDNEKDVAELPAPARKGLKIHLKKHIDEIIEVLFPLEKKKKKS